ncbi:NAD(P)/FAD-dependent oxidoreductase [Altericroceibacterium endophyticum]|uniref:FAD-dependent oxidoreductase n=1 Tax=Altericroceibacterium endophyticum TaxID=1808508 RepID=A0A6I4T8Y4_9SPHN|nr:FAD-dependent oxidoreductase [Altericroceibacterium endophyticum]MXO66503.1 FAD-dependent oxidoreductase [Altericroceibacterium endophyticum]
MNNRFDIAIIGAGMAGASLAAELAGDAKVLILEAEDRPGYHATGRSAAFWVETYGGPGVQPLTTAAGPYLQEQGVLVDRGALTIGRSDQQSEADAFAKRFAASGVEMHMLGRAELAERIPGLKPDWTIGILEPTCCDIDVAALHAHYLTRLRRAGVTPRSRARLVRAERRDCVWFLETSDGQQFEAAVVVNAAGAWADPVAQSCGANPLGIIPYRRTIAQLRTDPAPSANLPLVLDLAEKFYFKPENGRLWLSPHDETPSVACDAAAEELDVALAIDRLQQVVDWRVDVLEHRWAGLRSFAPDRLPVYGFDPDCEGFFWFAGQGGFGIQTAPAAARLGAQLLLDQSRDAMTHDLDPAAYSPSRFR